MVDYLRIQSSKLQTTNQLDELRDSNFNLKKILCRIFYKLSAVFLYTLGATTLNKKLKVGDEVWVETLETYIYNNGLNVFSGSLIHLDF